MHAVILAGGLGTRLSEETVVRPKPMVEIGERPILWHIMKHLGTHGIEDFVICLGYRGDVIRDWFRSYHLHTSDVTLDLVNRTTTVHASRTEPWRVTLLETGAMTPTGGRLKQAMEHLERVDEDPGTILMTYGDGVSDVDVTELRNFHGDRGTLATVTAVQPPGRWGAIDLAGDRVGRTTRPSRRSRCAGSRARASFRPTGTTVTGR
jgi:glucose-1-phosphate cytidylyltransferase